MDYTKRIFDFLIASILIIVFSPVLFFIFILQRIIHGTPVLFVQLRPGLKGAPFKMYKFRTMYVEPGENSQVWAQKDDPRITPVGKVLRAFRLDELPQLWNVMLGHMNMVGPRPEQPAIFRELREEIPEYAGRQRVLPGITGWAQINNGRRNQVRPGALILWIVTTKLSPVRIDEKPVTNTPMAVRLTLVFE